MIAFMLFFSVPFLALVALPAFALVAKVKKEEQKSYKLWQVLAGMCLVILIVWLIIFIKVGFF